MLALRNLIGSPRVLNLVGRSSAVHLSPKGAPGAESEPIDAENSEEGLGHEVWAEAHPHKGAPTLAIVTL